MFHLISWSDFLFTIFLVLFSYWMAIGLIYYKYEIRSIAKRGFKKKVQSNSKSNDFHEDDLFGQCNDCASKVKSFIRQEGMHEPDKGNLLSEMKIIVRQHPLLFSTKWQIPINNLIRYECKQHCSAEISDEELRTLWKQ